MLREIFEPVYAVIVNEDEGNICELKITPDDIYRLLKGTATFIGQWSEIDVVILKCDESPFDLMKNRNILPPPFHQENVRGPILLMRMDEDAMPADFRLAEYQLWRATMNYPQV
jgi:hypothetical protein